MLVVPVATDEHADVVQHRRRPEQVSDRLGILVQQPASLAKYLRRKPCHLLTVLEAGRGTFQQPMHRSRARIAVMLHTRLQPSGLQESVDDHAFSESGTAYQDMRSIQRPHRLQQNDRPRQNRLIAVVAQAFDSVAFETGKLQCRRTMFSSRSTGSFQPCRSLSVSPLSSRSSLARVWMVPDVPISCPKPPAVLTAAAAGQITPRTSLCKLEERL